MTVDNQPVFVTLGPSGTNHEMVTHRYLAFRGIQDPTVILVDNFDDALTLVQNRKADFILMCGVHPQCASIVGKASFSCDVHVVDVFISPSQPLGILTRTEVQEPQTLALQPATATYTDISGWPETVNVNSIMLIAEGLLNGRYDSGLTALKLAEDNPGKFRVDCTIGSPDDPWLVLGRHRVCDGEMVAWKDAPAAEFMVGYQSTKANGAKT